MQHGQCNADWAFSLVQVAESAYAISTHKLLKFSEQKLIDCTILCGGSTAGSSASALIYKIDFQDGQYCLSSDYKCTGTQGECRFDELQHYGPIAHR